MNYELWTMKTETRNKIYEIIKEKSPIWATKIAEVIGFSNEVTHRHLKKLIAENKVYKVWNPPKVFYFPSVHNNQKEIIFPQEDNIFLKNNFIHFTPDGRILYWQYWFQDWCEKRNLDPKKEIEIYKDTLKKYTSFKDEYGFIDWKEKMKNTFEKVYLDEVYYLDFYSIEKYGKTLLWNLMFYWKQNWDKDVINQIIEKIKNPIYDFIHKKNIDSFAFIPPSIDRKIQILTQIKKWLAFPLQEIKLLKIFKDKIVSQKSLNKKEDRIINARETIFLENTSLKANKVLLIDDAVGSWSTLNETAKKIKEKWISNYVIWIAVVWSFKWFEVINEI